MFPFVAVIIGRVNLFPIAIYDSRFPLQKNLYLPHTAPAVPEI